MSSNIIYILSGEGEKGTFELYTGATDDASIKRRLAQERVDGRWARAIEMFGYDDGGNPYGYDLETDETRILPHDRAVKEAFDKWMVNQES